jgi:predicted KAP-like P-loop ATPase
MKNLNCDTSPLSDLLNRESFAETIAYGLVQRMNHSQNSIVFGLNGRWGSGKSTLLNFLKISIEKEFEHSDDKNFLIFEFNPWMFSGQQELQSQFLNEFAKALGSTESDLHGYIKKLSDAVGNFSWVKYINSTAGQVQQGFSEALKKFAADKPITKLRSEIDDLIIKSGLRIFIFIDDIDRLNPSEIADILNLVKLNGSFANTTYILAYDREVVEKAISAHYNVEGPKYIEKIIQVDYAVPEILD